MAEDAGLAAELRGRLGHVLAGASRRLLPVTHHRGPIRTLGRVMLLTIALMALRVFIAFSRSALRIR